MPPITWEDLENVSFEKDRRLVLRHNTKLQYGAPLKKGDSLGAVLKEMMEYCKEHKDGNKKITGPSKVVEHAKMDGCPLASILAVYFRKRDLNK